MSERPLFVTLGKDGDTEWPVTLLLRFPGDRDYFRWGEIDKEQYEALEMAGVLEMTDSAEEGVSLDDLIASGELRAG